MIFLLRMAARRRKNADATTPRTNTTTKHRMTDTLVEAISDWATMIGIGIGIIAWWFAREDASRKADALELFKSEAAKHTAQLEKDGAELKNKAAQAQLELERIKEARHWRRLRDEERSRLGSILKTFEGRKVLLTYPVGDKEAKFLCFTIRTVCLEAGIDCPEPVRDIEELIGITILYKRREFSHSFGKALIDFFQSTNLKVAVQGPLYSIRVDEPHDGPDVVLRIGSRSPFR